MWSHSDNSFCFELIEHQIGLYWFHLAAFLEILYRLRIIRWMFVIAK